MTKELPSLEPPRRKPVYPYVIAAFFFWTTGAITPMSLSILYTFLKNTMMKDLDSFGFCVSALAVLVSCTILGVMSIIQSEDHGRYNKINNL